MGVGGVLETPCLIICFYLFDLLAGLCGWISCDSRSGSTGKIIVPRPLGSCLFRHVVCHGFAEGSNVLS